MKAWYRFRGPLVALWALVALGLGQGGGPWGFLGFLLPFLVLRIWARRYIGGHSRGAKWDAPLLVQGGPYRWIRHPLYLSNLGVAWALLGWWGGMTWTNLWLALLLVLFYDMLARAEDAFLAARFGDAWEAWRRMVPCRWFPLHWPRLMPVEPGRSWWDAFFADRWTWLWLALCVVLLALLRGVL